MPTMVPNVILSNDYEPFPLHDHEDYNGGISCQLCTTAAVQAGSHLVVPVARNVTQWRLWHAPANKQDKIILWESNHEPLQEHPHPPPCPLSGGRISGFLLARTKLSTPAIMMVWIITSNLNLCSRFKESTHVVLY
jgi:hypothetical protein